MQAQPAICGDSSAGENEDDASPIDRILRYSILPDAVKLGRRESDQSRETSMTSEQLHLLALKLRMSPHVTELDLSNHPISERDNMDNVAAAVAPLAAALVRLHKLKSLNLSGLPPALADDFCVCTLIICPQDVVSENSTLFAFSSRFSTRSALLISDSAMFIQMTFHGSSTRSPFPTNPS